MTQRHKHADLIIAWANGAKIQFRIPSAGRLDNPWHDCPRSPEWHEKLEYRIKPEPKPDKERYAHFYSDGLGYLYDSKQQAQDVKHPALGSKGILKFIFDGETGSIKSVEVLK